MNEHVSSQELRDALAHFASGVTIVMTDTPGGPVGLTASAFTPVSLAPPLILVCIGQERSAHDALVHAQHFGVSVLAERQGWIADKLGRAGIDRFGDIPLRHGACTPLVDGALVQLLCRPYANHNGGDHTILIGEVLNSEVRGGAPLVHFGRKMGRFVAD